MNLTHLTLAMLGGALGAGLRYWLGAALLQKLGSGLLGALSPRISQAVSSPACCSLRSRSAVRWGTPCAPC